MRNPIYKSLVIFLLLSLPLTLFAVNGKITGKVTDSKTGEALPGTNVAVKGTSLGAAADLKGSFTIDNVPPGTYTLMASFIGYGITTKEVKVAPEQTVQADFALEEEIISGATITVLADRAKIRETPVAFSNVEKKDMEVRLGSRDIPLVLNTTPSVYATQQGGGAGDARINVRGFNQRNVAIMINGVPVNDMENGWVYWSNWDGVGDATSSIQMQRGLSAVNLATPSIGGTMNVLTDPTAMTSGVKFKQEIGTAGFLKTTLMANTGLIKGKYALSAGIVRKVGEGWVDKTWTDAWAYYLGASWQLNKNNRLELYALGAPQRHGQNLYKQNIAVYDTKFAKSLGDYDQAALDKYHEMGRKFNQNWAPVSPSYTGLQNVEGKTFDRHSASFINSRENFYHKPQVNLNWYSKLSDNLGIYSVFYYSGGMGGGTGTYGTLAHKSWEGTYNQQTGKYYYFGAPWSWDWNATIAINRDSTHAWIDKKEYTKEKGQSLGILRNSRNNQGTLGAISKINYKLSDSINMTAGVDWRTAKIEHYREIRDLLGGSYFIFSGNAFDSESQYKKGLGDKVDYFFTNTVDWIGFFGQTEYTNGKVSAYGMAGYSTIKYSYVNHFRKNAAGSELTANSDNIGGYQVKGGASYRITDAVNLYGNGGYVSKVPIFDNVINDRTGTKAKDPKNEKFTSVEFGTNFIGMDGKFTLNANYYYTKWTDRAKSIGVQNADGSEGIVFLSGMNSLHSGIELEGAFQPNRLFRLDGAASVGNWKNTDDVKGVYKDYTNGGAQDVQYDFYVKDLKSGDAPQTQFALMGSVFPTSGSMAQLVVKHYRNNYADWDPFGRTDKTDRKQSWKAPNYSVIDFHAFYDLPFSLGKTKIRLFAHVFNLLDATYIQDAVDNSKYNAFDKDHDADDAEVFFGLPRTFNLGLSLNY